MQAPQRVLLARRARQTQAHQVTRILALRVRQMLEMLPVQSLRGQGCILYLWKHSGQCLDDAGRVCTCTCTTPSTSLTREWRTAHRGLPGCQSQALQMLLGRSRQSPAKALPESWSARTLLALQTLQRAMV